MNPIDPSLKSLFANTSIHGINTRKILNHLKTHQTAFLTLTEEEFKVIQSDASSSKRSFTLLSPEELPLSFLFYDVFGMVPERYSYDHILQLRLAEWGSRSINNQQVAEKITTFLHNHSEDQLFFNPLDIRQVPDIWHHSSFTLRLKVLHLDNHQITSFQEPLTRLFHLQQLRLSNNQLTFLPESFGNLRSLKTLYLNNNRLTSLPSSFKHLRLLEVLNLDNNLFTSIPESLKNLSWMDTLSFANNHLTSLPASSGNLPRLEILKLQNNPDLTSLQEALFQLPSWCTIHLEGCGLSASIVAQAQARMNASGYTGPTITFSIREIAISSKSMDELLTELFITSETDPFPLPEGWANKESLRMWLNRLSSMADYHAGKGARRKALASKVLSFIRLAAHDPTFQTIFFPVIEEATTTCGDRMALSILHLGIAYKLAMADKKDLKGLATLLTRGSLALETLQEVAFNKVKNLFGCDPIEVYLGYPVMLKETLHLPIDVEEMLYFRCSSLQQEDLIVAEEIVLSRFNDQERLFQDLCKRDLWIKALQENYPEKAPAHDLQEAEETWIALTKEALSSWTA